MTMRRLMERRRAAIASADAGFTLVELIVAMMIIATVLLLLMAVQTSALVTTTQAKQRQEGSAVANELMEELRALPWASLQRGLHPSYATAGVDPSLVGSEMCIRDSPSIHEALVVTAGVNGQGLDTRPLSVVNGSNLTQRTDPAVPGVVFKARTYVSTSTTLAPGVLTLTVIVTWKPASSTVEKFAMARSAAYSPASGGCGNASTQPFLGACQAMLDADAGADGVSVSFTGLDPINPASPVELLTSSSVDRAMLTTAETSATMQSNQAASMSAPVTSAGSSQDSMLGVDDSSGRVRVRNAASTGVGAADAAPANPAYVSATGMAASRTVTGSPATLSIT